MSYREHKTFGTIVVCDVCDTVGAVFDRHWQEMRCDAQGEPIHVCRNCRKTAVWCDTHHCYHKPTDNHRCACVACGGLYTSVVQQGIKHCPSCRRALPAPPAPAPRAPSLRNFFLHLGFLH